MPRNQLAIILDIMISLNRGSSQIPDLGDHCTCCTDQYKDPCHILLRDHRLYHEVPIKPAYDRGTKDTSNGSFYRFLGTQLWHHLMLTDHDPHSISTGITDPGADKDHPYGIISIGKRPYQIYAGQHDRRIDHVEKGAHDLICVELRKSKHIQKHKGNQYHDQNKKKHFFLLLCKDHYEIISHNSCITNDLQIGRLSLFRKTAGLHQFTVCSKGKE